MTGTADSRWQGQSGEELAARWGVPRVVVFESVGSTNDVARELAGEGAAHGTVVVASHQSAGRGRAGRTWHAPAGSALLLSCVLRPTAGSLEAGVLPLRVGLATTAAVREATGSALRIKWPNDLLDGSDRKVGGILCEGVSGGANSWVVAGVGVNANQTPADFPPGLRGASLRMVTGAGIDLPRLADALVPRVVAVRLEGVLDAAETAALAERDALRGRRVRVEGGARGEALGVSREGALLLRSNGGADPVKVFAGSVRLEDEAGEIA